MSIRQSFVVACLLTVCCAGARAADNTGADVGDRTIVLAPSVAGAGLFPLKNPGVVTLGTLSILNRIDFAISAFTTNGNGGAGGKLSYLWNWGDGTPPGTNAFPNHTYLVAGTYNVTVTTTEAGNPTPTVNTITVTVTDAVKKVALKTNERWSNPNHDALMCRGLLHIPTGISLAGQTVFIDIGGIQFTFVLDGSGKASISSNANVTVDPTTGASTTTIVPCKATFKINTAKGPVGSSVDAPFILSVGAAAFSPALADETVTNRDARHVNVRITVKITAFGILFQSGVNQIFTSSAGKSGTTR